MIYAALIMFFYPALVAAALYPTSPISSTVFHPGPAHTSFIRWKDDAHAPSTDQLGYLRIDLMLADAIISTLANSVPCTYYEVKIHIPVGLGPDSSDYALKFTPSLPFAPIYSARFTISNQTSNLATDITYSSSSFSAVISTVTAPPTHTSTVVPTVTFTPGREKIGTTANGGHSVRIASSTRFRVLYVVWPVLVGAALAS